MLTTCLHCRTTFRITTEQLQAHNGQVRCGNCRQIFDAYKELKSEDDDVAANIASLTNTSINLRTPSPETITPALAPTAAPVPVTPVKPAAPAVKTPASPVVESVIDIPALVRRKSSKGWKSASIFLVFVLLLQGVYYFRGGIIARAPQTRAVFESVCAKLGCSVALPQQPHDISIEASDMQATDPANPSQVKLTAVLHSKASAVIGYPALDVVLTDGSDHTVARRIFAPTEYLNKKQNARDGIAPDAEVTVQLALDTGDLNASGFRVDVLAAPN